MELLEAIVILIVAIASLITIGATIIKLAVKQSEKALDAERKARQDLVSDLRNEVQMEKQDSASLRYRVKELEDARLVDAQRIVELESLRKSDKAEVEKTQRQLETVLTEMAALQEQGRRLKADLEDERDEKARVLEREAALIKRVSSLELSNTYLTIERDTLRDLIRARLDASNSTESTASVSTPEPGESAPNSAGE